MKRVIALLVCSSALSACSSFDFGKWSTPSLDMSAFKGTAGTVNVRVESEPAGAEAKGPTGISCRTPCSLGLPSGLTNVTFALQGYQPQTVPVTITTLPDAGDLPDTGTPVDNTRVDPNPVYAILQPAPPPPPPPRKKKPAKPKPRPQAAAPQLQQQQPQQQLPPPPQASSPPPGWR